MKVMKKILSLVLILAMALFLLAACGGSDSTSTPSENEPKEEVLSAPEPDGPVMDNTPIEHPDTIVVGDLLASNEAGNTMGDVPGIEIIFFMSADDRSNFFSINNGAGIIFLDGAMYINGQLTESTGTVEMPEMGTRTAMMRNGFVLYSEDYGAYVSGGENVLFIDLAGNITAHNLTEDEAGHGGSFTLKN